jgi:hypothetical protein
LLPVHLDVELVRLFLRRGGAAVVLPEVAQRTLDVRQRIEALVGEQRLRERAEPAHGNLVVRKRPAGERVAHDDPAGEQAAQIALAPRQRDHRGERVGRRHLLPRALIVAEEEHLVADDGAAERAAEDVPRKLRLAAARAAGGPRRRRQVVVPPVIERVAAELVRARLQDDVHQAAGHVSELGRVVVRLDADLLHRVRARLIRDQVVDRVVHVDAVEAEVVRLLALAVHERPAAADVLQTVEGARIGGHRAGGVERGGRQVPPLDRERLHLPLLQRVADHRVLGLQHGTRRHHLDALFDRAHFEREVDARRLVRRERHGRLHALEALQLRRDHVRPDRHAGDDVVAGFVRHAGVGDVRRLVGRRDREPRQRRLG